MTLRNDARGAVMVETLLAFMPLFMLFLGVVQYVLLALAQLVVQHAAVAGVRSASVVLDDDPARYDGAERLTIHASAASDASSAGDLLAIGEAWLGVVPPLPERPELPRLAGGMRGYGPRIAPIRNAVYAKLAAIVPARALAALAGAPGTSVLDALGRSPVVRLAQAPLYLPVTTAITFPSAPGSEALLDERVEKAGPVTVRVTHLVTCTIPLVAAIMCRSVESLDTEEGGSELDRAPGAALQPLLERAGVRGVVMRAEASMPLQHASYAYASQREAKR